MFVQLTGPGTEYIFTLVVLDNDFSETIAITQTWYIITTRDVINM
jgi:hypothetical protein